MPFGVLAAAGGGLRIDGERGLHGQLLHLPVGLAGQFRDDHRLGRGRVLGTEQVQGRVYRPGLGNREVTAG